MFTFAPGFEAATLKHPPGSIRRDGTAALLDQLHNVAAARAAAAAAYGSGASGMHDAASLGPGSLQGSSGDDMYGYTPDGQYPINTQMEEALATLSLGGTASTSSATTPSAAVSMTPSAPSGPLLGGGSGSGSGLGPGGLNGLSGFNNAFASTGLQGLGGSTSASASGTGSAKRRQIIGFARFKTRQDALIAREVLQGKRIDSLGAGLGLGLGGASARPGEG